MPLHAFPINVLHAVTPATVPVQNSPLRCESLFCDAGSYIAMVQKKNKWHPNNGINLGHSRVTSLLLKQLLATWDSRYVSLDYFRPPFISCVSPGHKIAFW